MLTLLPGSAMFAIAGLAMAAAPIVIHLLNRRRFRVVQWAAMEFLAEALQRSRNLLRFSDILLLVLRTAALLLFGLALARPYLSYSTARLEPNQPMHAVLVIDNSLSMGYAKLDKTLLDEAKAKAGAFVADLPEGSVISVIPSCGVPGGLSSEAYRSKDDARDAIAQISVADRTANIVAGADLALRACRSVAELPTKRVVFLGDQQLINWPADSVAAQFKELSEVQIVSVAADEPDNTWIDQFALQDDLADVETPAIFKVVVRHEGPVARKDLPVTLSIDGVDVASTVIDLEPGQARELTFPYTFTSQVERGTATFVPAKVSIPPDHLKDDDARYLAVPVVSRLPVVFVDQWGADENPRLNRYGETRPLRRLLTPFPSASGKSAAAVRHVRIEQLDRKMLQDARLVVIAGVPSPEVRGAAAAEGTTRLLRDFVEQGGQLFIAAGGDFDPVAWNTAAWRQGAGILPLPLEPKPIGQSPEGVAGPLKPFFLSLASMSHDLFDIADIPREELQALYGLPLFFKAVRANTGDQVVAAMLAAEAKRIEEKRNILKESEQRLKTGGGLESKDKLTEEDRLSRERDEQKRAELQPSWLLWVQKQVDHDEEIKPAEVAERTRPRVLAAYDNTAPFLVRRRLGRGQVMMMTSGTFSTWNTLPRTNAVMIFHRILRSMLLETLPPRNLSSIEQIVMPVSDRSALYALTRPDGSQEPLTAEAISADLYGVIVRNQGSRGIYKLTASRQERGQGANTDNRMWEAIFSVNGPSRESEPAVLTEKTFKERLGGDAKCQWIGRNDAISVEGAVVKGQNLWQWLIAGVLLCLAAESVLVVWPRLVQERRA